MAHESDLALRINVMSFGFKYGIPLDADHVLDVRFIPNPYWVSELRHLTGRDAPVADYVFAQKGRRPRRRLRRPAHPRAPAVHR